MYIMTPPKKKKKVKPDHGNVQQEIIPKIIRLYSYDRILYNSTNDWMDIATDISIVVK